MELLSFLESVLGDSEKKSKGNYRFKCPLPDCSSVRKRLEIQINTTSEGLNLWKCWVCNRGGATLQDLFYKAHISHEKIQILNTLVTPSETKTYDKVESDLYLPAEFENFNFDGQENVTGKLSKSYLKKRGYSQFDILKYSLGFCSKGRYRNRIIIPSFDATGKLNYFAGRSFLQDEDIKYLYPEIPRKDIIPFELYINWNVPIVLCEGFFDAITIGNNALPLLEKGINQGILKKLLSKEVKTIYLALDNDALSESLDHAEVLMGNGKKVYLVEMNGKDPSEIGRDAFNKLVDSAELITRDQLLIRKLQMRLYE